MSDHVLGKVVFGPDGLEGRRSAHFQHSALQAEQTVIRQAVLEQREADAALVEAAGCICWDLPRDRTAALASWDPAKEAPEVTRHDPRCPVALAAKIRGQA